ncbi:terminase large subunit domain-containing protein [Streptomyces ipomoeae]|uniref:terminase large subunit domain-containing protein n=1 Tax=Streptomyces ipomoeae TaxID=103232 RepID=UPI00114667E4|nr:terminase family protein [Streptomyces ipomoeae]TQE33044.1 terminase, large subunit [Streptomyces ipomoeae]
MLPAPDHEERLLARYRTLPRQQRLTIARSASPELRLRLAQLEREMAMDRSPGSLAALLTGGREMQARHLDLIDQAFIKIAKGERVRLLLNMPPRHGKSQRAARWAPLWYLRRNPTHRLMIASYSAVLAEGHGRWLRDTIAEHGEQLGISLRYGSKAAGRFDLTGVPGGLVTAGVGGSLTGMGAHLAVVDDPLKDAKAAASPTVLGDLWDWWQQVLNTRMEPTGSIVVIQTRWSENDLAGRILAQDAARDTARWTVINLPAIADSADDALGRALGEPLWPDRFNLQHLADFREEVGERGWWALYQQQPRPLEGGIWKWEWIRGHRITVERLRGITLTRVVVAVDPAGGGEDSDEVGIVAAGRDAAGQLYILADRSGKLGAADWGRAACELALEVEADALVVESNFGGDMARQVLVQGWEQLVREGAAAGVLRPRIVPVTAKQGKRLRAEPIAQLYEQGHVHHVGEWPALEVQMVTWMPGMDSPDRMDAAVHGLTELADPAGFDSGTDSYRDGRLNGRR